MTVNILFEELLGLLILGARAKAGRLLFAGAPYLEVDFFLFLIRKASSFSMPIECQINPPLQLDGTWHLHVKFMHVVPSGSTLMPSLQIRDLPVAVYEKLRELAAREQRSLTQQAIVALERGLDLDPEAPQRRKRLVEAIGQEAEEDWPADLASPVELIRRERDR